MASVFVSYAREDAVKAKALTRALEEASLDVWFDERIHSGSEYSREIEEALRDASAVVVLWSRHSVESAWVRDEAAEGRDSGRLVPIVIDGCRPPIGFRQLQTTDLSAWSGRGRPKRADDVIAAIRAKAGATPPVDAGAARLARPRGSIGKFVGVTAVVVAGGAIAAFLLFGPAREPSSSPPSIALVPFTADSPDSETRQIAAATHDSVAHMLSQGAFAVSVLDSVPAGGSPRADFIISGHLSSSSEGITATVRMDETAHHFVVFSHQFEANSKETSGFPERVGAQVAAQLSWTAPALVVERRHPSDPAVTAAVLQTSSTGLSGGGNLHDYETTRRLAMRAPDSPLAQEAFAVNTAFALDQLPREQRAQAVAEARRAADRTTMLAPDYAGGSIAWCLLQNNVHLIECEDRLRAGMRADPDSAFAGWFLSADLNEVGRNRESLDLAKLSLAHDQYMLFKIARALLMLEEAGRTQEAAKLYQRSAQWWPNNPAIFGYQFTGILERGDFRALQKFNEEGGDRSKAAPILAAINSGSIAQVRASCSAGNASTNALCILALARVGDLDTAFDLAKRVYPSRLGHSTTDADRIWLDNPDEELLAFITSPAAAPLRRDPRYFALAERTGLVAYWRSGRLPDFCQPPNPEPICIQLLKR